jgi:hypothetical protein
MKKLTYTFKVPSWFPTRLELEHFRRWVPYKLNPPRCPSCNTKIISNNEGYFAGKINDQDFYVNLRPTRCAKCAEEYINSLNLEKIKCASCGETKNGTGFHKNDGNIMSMYWHPFWNGSSHCVDCITYVIRTGKFETNYLKYNRFTKKFGCVYY